MINKLRLSIITFIATIILSTVIAHADTIVGVYPVIVETSGKNIPITLDNSSTNGETAYWKAKIKFSNGADYSEYIKLDKQEGTITNKGKDTFILSFDKKFPYKELDATLELYIYDKKDKSGVFNIKSYVEIPVYFKTDKAKNALISYEIGEPNINGDIKNIDKSTFWKLLFVNLNEWQDVLHKNLQKDSELDIININGLSMGSTIKNNSEVSLGIDSKYGLFNDAVGDVVNINAGHSVVPAKSSKEQYFNIPPKTIDYLKNSNATYTIKSEVIVDKKIDKSNTLTFKSFRNELIVKVIITWVVILVITIILIIVLYKSHKKYKEDPDRKEGVNGDYLKQIKNK